MSIAEILNEGRLIRGNWAETDEQGRQLLCLYTALAGDPAARPDTCPSHLAPQWLAHLLPFIDDRGSNAHWPEVVRRVADMAPRFVRLAGALSRRTEYEVRALCVEEAMRHTTNEAVLAPCQTVVTLCRRVARGDEPDAAKWAAARGAAAAWAEAEAEAATEAEAAAEAARAAARAADRLIDAILDAIERAVSGPEHTRGEV